MSYFKHICFLATSFLFCCSFNAQTIAFTYNHGNMTQRSILVTGFRLANPFSSSSDTIILSKKELAFNVYPNPTNDQITVEGKLPEQIKQANVYLYNISGQMMRSAIYTGGALSVPVADLKPDMYLLEVSYSKEKRSTYKIVITNH